ISVEPMAAINWVALMYVVERTEPFQFTTEPLTKPVPLTVRPKAVLPVVALAGDRLLMVGTGLGPLIVNAELLDVPPPGAGLNTVICPVPALARSPPAMAAV